MSLTPNPSFSIKATDWEIAGICQIGGAETLGAGVWFFKLRSAQAGVDEPFNYSGVLLGMGGSIGGISLPSPSAPRQMSYSPIQCRQAFSIYDLDGSMGRITTVGGSLVVGYSILYVSAFNMSGNLYVSQTCNGFSAGVGAMGATSAGTWTHM